MRGTHSRWRRAALGAAAGALLFAGACGGSEEGPTQPNAQVIGTYPLRTVNGSALPAVLSIETGGRRVDLLSEALTFNANGGYAHTANQRTTNGSQVTTETLSWSGTYTVAGNQVTLSRAPDGARATLAAGTDGSLTLVAGGLTFVYRK